MNIKNIGPNQTELHLNCGAIVFFSYETPVAAQLPDGSFIRTSTKYSVTTSKHINRWLSNVTADTVDQTTLDQLIKG